MEVRLLRHFGMIPEILFRDRSKIRIFDRWQRFGSMLPLNPLDCRERIFRDGMLSPIQPGISPRNLFELRSKNTRELQFLKDKGNSPTKLLLCKFNVWRLSIDPMELGISPEKLLLAKFRTTRPKKFIKQSGIDPVNRLFERSRTHKIPIPTPHRKEAGPENLLWESNKVDVVLLKKVVMDPQTSWNSNLYCGDWNILMRNLAKFHSCCCEKGLTISSWNWTSSKTN